MTALFDYILNHTDRNACRCGNCIISGENKPMVGHTVNMYFFDVCAKNDPNKDEFVKLIDEHQGEFGLNLFEGEHSYLQVGGWLGDQGVGMQLMALGKLLGVWDIMHPGMMLDLNDPRSKVLAEQMAGIGMVSIVQLSSEGIAICD